MKKLIFKGLMLVAGILFLATSCTQNDSEGTAGGKGSLSILLTDAPFPSSLVKNTFVTIDKIEIRSTLAGTATATTEEADAKAVYTVVYEGEGKEFDLLKLQNGISDELANADLEPGSYDFIRMHVTQAEVVLKDGTSYDLKVPSGLSSGLKIKITPNLVIESGIESTIVLDFDVHKSFIVQGNPKTLAGIKGFMFKPVLRAVCQQYTGILSGKVTENVTTPVKDALVEIMLADTVYSSAVTETDGTYAMIGIPAASYLVVVSKEGYTDVEVNNVVVKEKETTTLDVNIVSTATGTTTNP